jgi:hypothetical protein
MSTKQVEKKYNCTVHSDFVDGFRFYQAYPNDKNSAQFESASGWSLEELVTNIKDNLLVKEAQEHTCDTCKSNYKGYDVTMKEECEGCCSWNDKWEPKEY